MANHRTSALIGFAAAILGIVVTIATIPYWAGNLAGDISSHSRRLDLHRTVLDGHESRIASLEGDVKVIKADTQWIREGIADLKERQREMYGTQLRHYQKSAENNKLLKNGAGR